MALKDWKNIGNWTLTESKKDSLEYVNKISSDLLELWYHSKKYKWCIEYNEDIILKSKIKSKAQAIKWAKKWMLKHQLKTYMRTH